MPWLVRALVVGSGTGAAYVVVSALVLLRPHGGGNVLSHFAVFILVWSGVFLPMQYAGYRIWLRKERQQTPPASRP
jgi:hypothetical protein